MTDAMDTLRKLGRRYPQLDVARVGVVGEGFGGYFAAMALLLHPEAFAAAIATSPIVDWELHDAAFTERYLRAPTVNADGYRRCSALVYAERLSRPLMLAHAFGDLDIHAAHSLALLEALQAAQKQVDFVVLPAGADPRRDRRQLEFLRRHLGPPVRPGEMPKGNASDEDSDD
jgi:dipeptidyl-peptidase-4